jgi:hypothetical protein
MTDTSTVTAEPGATPPAREGVITRSDFDRLDSQAQAGYAQVKRADGNGSEWVERSKLRKQRHHHRRRRGRQTDFHRSLLWLVVVSNTEWYHHAGPRTPVPDCIGSFWGTPAALRTSPQRRPVTLSGSRPVATILRTRELILPVEQCIILGEITIAEDCRNL